ncbi:MAG: cytochrome ubiquinol oxidase subunit I, partial [Gammaproteobacteria bacterium]
LISAFWILAANSWMQTPQGFIIEADGRLAATNWLAVIFNPSFPYRFMHMITAAYLTTAFVVGGTAAFYLWKQRHIPQAKIMLTMATLMAAIVAPIQLFIGDQHGLNTLEHQPAKIAAMEGIWDTEKSAGLRLFAWPDQHNETNHYEIIIPKVASLILTHSLDGEIKGLKEWPKEDRPPVAWVFWSFRVMVAIGMLMILLGLLSAVAYFRKTLFTSRFLHTYWMLMMPSGFIAVLAGWFVTEIGRQPYTAYGVIRTIESVSPAIIGPQVAWSLLAFVVMYIFVFGAGSYYILKLLAKGISETEGRPGYYSHSRAETILQSNTSSGENHV